MFRCLHSAGRAPRDGTWTAHDNTIGGNATQSTCSDWLCRSSRRASTTAAGLSPGAPARGKLACSFGFDDSYQQSSFIQVHDPESLRIILQPLR